MPDQRPTIAESDVSWLRTHDKALRVLSHVDVELASKYISGRLKASREHKLGHVLSFIAVMDIADARALSLQKAVKRTRPQVDEFVRLVLFAALEQRLHGDSWLAGAPENADAADLILGWGNHLLRPCLEAMGIDGSCAARLAPAQEWKPQYLPLLFLEYLHLSAADRDRLRLILKLALQEKDYAASLGAAPVLGRYTPQERECLGRVRSHNAKSAALFAAAGIDAGVWSAWKRETQFDAAPPTRRGELLLTVRPWKRSPTRDLFQGNEVRNCLAIGYRHGRGMLDYLLDLGLQTLEILTPGARRTIASAPVYPVVDAVGRAYLMLDYIEILPQMHRFRDPIREAVFDCTRAYRRTAWGDGCAGILMGPRNNHVDVSALPRRRLTLRKLGGFLGPEMMLDAFSPRSWTIDEPRDDEYLAVPAAGKTGPA
jgi:hypothetical protein